MNTSVKKHYASHRARKIAKVTSIYVVLAIVSVIWILPFVYLLLQSFAGPNQSMYFIPHQWSLRGYEILFTEPTQKFWLWWINTFILAFATAIIQTLITLATSYALSRLRFRLRKPIMQFMLVIGMFPSFLGMVIIYYILKLLGMEGSIYSLILIYVGSSAMGYYISKGFFDTIPKSLEHRLLPHRRSAV